MKYGFGKFAPLFREDGLYLRLLHLEGPRADMFGAVDVLKAVVADCGDDLARELAPLLQNKNWRLKLVAASAMLVSGHKDSLPLLWDEIDKPSWVSPQLVATASLLDDGFEARARERLERRCVLTIEPGQDAWTVERHIALGPASWHWHSAKLMAAFAGVYGAMFPDSAWLEALLQAEDVKALLAADVDHGGEIAVRWRARAEAVLMGR